MYFLEDATVCLAARRDRARAGVPGSQVPSVSVFDEWPALNPVPAGLEVTMHEPFGLIRIQALPAPDVRHARIALALYAVEPRSTVTVALNVAGLRPGGIAGLVLLNKLHAWLGVERLNDGFTLAQFDEQSGNTSRVPLERRRVWLRAECDFVERNVGFSYGTDGRGFVSIGGPCPMGDGPIATKSIRFSLFSCATKTAAQGGHADFDSFVLTTDWTWRQDGWR